MNGRLNVRLVIVLGVVLAVSLAGFTAAAVRLGLWSNPPAVLSFLAPDPSGDLVQGDLAYEQGQYLEALEAYGKARNKRRNDLSIELKFIDAFLHQGARDFQTARRVMGDAYRQLDAALNRDPDHVPTQEKMYQFLFRQAEDLGLQEVWHHLYRTADTGVKRRAAAFLPRRYRGIAQTRRMGLIDLTDEERRQALEDLETVLKAAPDDVTVLLAQADWYLLESAQLDRSPATARQAGEHRDKAEALAAAVMAAPAHRDNLRVLEYNARLLARIKKVPAALEVADRMEKLVLSRPASAVELRRVADALEDLDLRIIQAATGLQPITSGMRRSRNLCELGLRSFPDDPWLHRNLGVLLGRQGLVDQALAHLKRASDAAPPGDVLEAWQVCNWQFDAISKQVNLLLTKADQTRDHGAKMEIVAQAEAGIRRLESAHAEAPINFFLRGKAAITREDWNVAFKELAHANALTKDQNVEALLLMAKVADQTRNIGAAADILVKLINRFPNLMPARFELARVLIELQQYDRAYEHVSYMLERNRDDVPARMLQALLYHKTGKYDDAVRTYTILDPDKNPQVVVPLARTYLAAGKAQQAADLLVKHLGRTPGNLDYLQLLLNIAPKETVLPLLEAARRSGADGRMLDIMKAAVVQGPKAVRQLAEEFLAGDTEGDPIKRLMALYEFHLRNQEAAKAEECLAQAAALGPQHPRVVDAQFGRALRQRQYEQAATLAALATRLDLDQAKGGFYQGHLAMAQGQAERAVSFYRQATELRPIYSDGYRYLGDALRLAGDFHGAVQEYDRALQQQPNNVNALHNQALALDAQDKFSEALRQWRLAVAFAPHNRSLLETYLGYEEQHGEAGRVLQKRQELAQAQPQDYDNKRALAALLGRRRQFREAYALVDEVAQAEGRTLNNMGVWAEIMLREGKEAEARARLLEHVQSLGSKATCDDWLLLARFQLNTNQLELALDAFQKAIALEPPVVMPATRELADNLFERGQFSQAAGYYDRIYAAEPNDRRVGQRLLESLIRAQNFLRAQIILDALVKVHGRDANLWILQGNIHQAAGKPDLARAALDAAVELEQKRPLVWIERAHLLMQSPGNEEQAKADLLQALKLDPRQPRARHMLAQVYDRQGQTDATIRELTTLLGYQPNHLPARIALAQQYLKTGDLALLKAHLEESARLIPNDPNWLRLHAKVLETEKKYPEAEEKLRRAYSMAPTLEHLYELTHLLLRAGKPQEALKQLEADEARVSKVPSLLALRGRAYAAVQDPARAAAQFDRARQSASDLTQMAIVLEHMVEAYGEDKAVQAAGAGLTGAQALWSQIAAATLEARVGRYTDCLKRLQPLEGQVAPGTLESRQYEHLVAVSLHQTGQYDRAIEAYRKIVARDPRNITAINNLAYVLADAVGRAGEAVTWAQKAMEIAPDNAQVLDTMGWAQFKAGRPLDAERYLDRSRALREFPANLYHLAMVHLRLGNSAKGQELLVRAKALAEERKDREVLQEVIKALEGQPK